jgi:hypothetical protein
MAQSFEGKHPPRNIPEYLGEFNINYIILINVENFKKTFFSKKNLKGK